jgi:hypothetical protein
MAAAAPPVTQSNWSNGPDHTLVLLLLLLLLLLPGLIPGR